MANIPNANHYRDRQPARHPGPGHRTRRSLHQPNSHRTVQESLTDLPPMVQRGLIGAGVTLVIYLLWGWLGIVLAAMLIGAVLFVLHKLHN